DGVAHRLWTVSSEPIHPLDQPSIGARQLDVGDAIGRHQIDRGAKRTDIQSMANEPCLERSALRRLITSLTLQIEGENGAERARARHLFAAGEHAKHVAVPGPDPSNSLKRVFLGEQHQGSERNGAGEGICRERMAMWQSPVE